MQFNQQLENLLKTNNKFVDDVGDLLKQNIRHSAEQFEDELIALLFENQVTKAHFFKAVGKAQVFDYRTFIDYVEDKNFLLDSYTKFSNKVGLTISNKHLKTIDKVVLDFPFKDCILEGGQSKDDEKRQEIFFNEVLAKDEINRLLDKKVIANAKKYAQDGISDTVEFTRDESGTIKDNLIIKGNNLLALHTLKSNFAGKVKLIYIDPPYNTGNDSFNYNDNFNHSTWLVFMKNRLEVARELLSDDGVIFVQCDDNEQAYLKVLMDEVFGRDNFLSNIIWKGRGGRQDTKHIAQIHETIICYSKIINNVELNKKTINDISKYTHFDEKENKYYKTQLVRKWGSNSKKEDRPNLFYKVEFQGNTVYPILPDGSDGCWRWSGKRLKIAIADDLIIAQTKNNKTELYEKIYQGNGTKEMVNNSVLDDTFSGDGARHLQNIFGKNIFEYSKPEGLLEVLIKITTKLADIVLDYHLGSGTTCAVAHKMGRQYIGIEQMDYIEDIAVKRMQKVIDGEQGGISKAVDWQGGGEFIYFELDKYNQAFIDNLNAIKQGHATAKTIEQLYEKIAEQAFLNYDVESNKLLENKADFEKLNLDQQLEFLFSILNKNQLYKNLSEIDDRDLTVSNLIKALNRDFYGQ